MSLALAMKGFRRLAIVTSVATVGLVVAGGLVRATGSGLGCPHWPGCFPGRFFPPLEYHAMIEWTHRTLVVVVTALIGALALWAVLRFRSARSIVIPAGASVVIVIAQAILGAIVVRRELDAGLVTLHFATGMLLLGSVVATAINASRPDPAARARPSDLSHLAAVAAAATFVLLIVGAYIRGLGAGLAFTDWPLMGGRLLPAAGRLATPHFVHRLLALVVGGLVIGLARRARRAEPRDRVIVAFGTTAAALYVAQVLAGALNVWTRLSAPAVVLHVALASLTWAATLGLAMVARTRLPAEADVVGQGARPKAPPPGLRDVVRAYARLTKPRIIVLLLVTTVPSMVVAARGWPGWLLVLATLVGGTLAAGGANAINCYVDRDIDAKMSRTSTRPIPAGSVTPTHALEFGIGLGITAFAFLWAAVNLLAAALAIAALLFYVFVYTIGLKRRGPQNIVIGGAAGAVPVLVGWAAVTGGLTWTPVVMFAIVFLWTPPHFWALALRFAGDYAQAGVPMLPVVAGRAETERRILRYSVLLVAITFVLSPVGGMGIIYLAAAAALGGWFIRRAVVLRRAGTDAAAMRLFVFSINYLALLFVAMALDAVVHIAA